VSGPAPKPASERQRRNKRDVGQLVPIESARIIPGPPPGLLALTKSAWEAFWTTPLAQLITDADLPALHRLFDLYDELDRIWRAAKKHRIVTGSQGQEVLNPLYRQADSLRGEIRQLEDRFGLTPMARLKLGVKFGEAKRSLADEVDDDEDVDDHQDEVDAIDVEVI
jgi:P27 family predicted phage terminase small subunit